MFISAAEDWVCDSFSVDIRYFAGKHENDIHLWEALIVLNPLPPLHDMNFHVETSQFYAGQFQLSKQPKQKSLKLLNRAAQGQIDVYGHSFCLSGEQPFSLYSEMIHRDRWFSDLHLQVIGTRQSIPSAIDVASIDNALRRNALPFDGLADIAGWLGLGDPRYSNNPPSINIRVGPPVDLIFSECKLENDQLRLILYAHPRFDISRVGLAVRAVPGSALESRKQVKSEINWKRARDGKREGIALIGLEQADSVLVMLMIGDTTVRRQWILDPAKARNSRLIAIQHFDRDLRMVRQAVLEPLGSDHFEKGIAALLFLLGFAPVLQVEKDSPDLVVTTPSGKLVIVECTTRFSDFSAKLGKLVDRKVSLSRALQASGHHSRVDAVLVCALPKAQIATQADELKIHQVILVTNEELLVAFDRLRFPNDPDEIIDRAIVQQATVGSIFNG